MLKKLISLVGVSLMFGGMSSLHAMNDQEIKIKVLCEPLFKLTKNLDSNLKTLLEFSWYNFADENYQKLYCAIDENLCDLVSFMKKDAFDWHPDLIKQICNEIKKQLIFSKNSSQFQRKMQIVTAWRMKNYLFDLFNQKTEYYFKSPVKVVNDNRSLEQVIQEYNNYKIRLSGISYIDQFFKEKEFDAKINNFKKDEKLFEDEIEYVKKSRALNFFTSDMQWALFNYVLPIINIGYPSLPDAFKEKQNNKIIKQDIEWQVTYLKQKKSELEVELKATLVKELQLLKQEIKSFKPLADSFMWPHKNFLNLIIELAKKECKRTTLYNSLYDSVSNYNPKKIVQNYVGENLLILNKPLKSVQKFLGQNSIETNIDQVVKKMVDVLESINQIDDISKFVWAPVFSLVVRMFDKIIESESCAHAIGNAGKLFSEEIPEKICKVREIKKTINGLNLSLAEAKELIALVGNDRLGILIKTVLRMVANDPKKSKKFLGIQVCELVKVVNNTFNYLQEKNESMSYNLFWNTRTKADNIYLLSYFAQENRKVIKLNKNNVKIVADVINNKNKREIRREHYGKDYAKKVLVKSRDAEKSFYWKKFIQREADSREKLFRQNLDKKNYMAFQLSGVF